MDNTAFSDLEKIVNQATDATEFKLVVATLSAMLGKYTYNRVDEPVPLTLRGLRPATLPYRSDKLTKKNSDKLSLNH